MFRASQEELDRGAGVGTVVTLRNFGATDIGPRQVLLGDTTNRRLYWCVVFPPDAGLIPLVAYVLTRVAPLHYGVTTE